MRKISKVFKLKSEEWLKKNAYKDKDGDYWKQYNDYAEWESGLGTVRYFPVIERELFLDDTIQDFTGDDKCTLEKISRCFDWGIEYYYNKEDHPEYFL